MLIRKNVMQPTKAFGLVLGLIAGMVPGQILAQQAEGPSAVQETYRDWIVRCEMRQDIADETVSAGRVCEMRQELRQGESNQLVLAVSLQPQTDGAGANLTLVAPFGLLLSKPIAIDIAEIRLIDVPYQTCLPRGCIAATTLDVAALAQLLAVEGNKARMTMTATDGQALTVSVSSLGLSDAWSRLQVLSKE